MRLLEIDIKEVEELKLKAIQDVKKLILETKNKYDCKTDIEAMALLIDGAYDNGFHAGYDMAKDDFKMRKEH